jgi:serine/threonine protein kinase
MSQQDSLLGKQLNEYRLEKLLGQGGMARVYRAIDTQLKRYVAIKVIDNKFRTDEEYVRRFEREAQAIARFDHPHVVSLHRYGNVDGLLYMAMQYVNGSDLAQLLDEYRADGEFMTADEILRIMREAGLGLDYVHRQGVIHRDIKPSNIMLKEDGTAIIADFGLVLLSDVGTRGEIFGTPHYMSPEQAVSSAKVVPQSDIYSMGVILYEMFTHRLPFEKGEPLDIAMAHMSEEPPPPSNYRYDLPEAIEEVILKALAKAPEDRYQTCEELSDALASAIRQTQSTRQKTPLPRQSIVERVQLDLKENPLPPIPASGAALPVPKVPEPERTQVSLSTLSALAAASSPVISGAEPTAPSTKQADRNRLLRPLIAAGVIGILALLAVFYAIRSDDLSDVEATGTAVVITNEALIVALTNTALPAGAVEETTTASVNATSPALMAETANSQSIQQTMSLPATSDGVNATNAAITNQQATSAVQLTQAADTLNSTNTAIVNQQATSAVQLTQAADALNSTSVAAVNQQATNDAQPTQAATVAVQPTQPTADTVQSAGALTGSASGTVVVQSTAAPTGPTIVLMIYTEGDNALRILRPAGDVANPLDLTPLLLIRADDDARLRDTNPNNDPTIPRQLSGAVWAGQSPLADNECINALKNSNLTPLVSGNPCTDRGTYYATDFENQAWDKEFNVYYNGTFVGTCRNGEGCRIEIPTSG